RHGRVIETHERAGRFRSRRLGSRPRQKRVRDHREEQQGLDVLGIDVSPLAIAVAKERGLSNATVLSIDELSTELGSFDTVLMLGNNFGLFGSAAKTRRMLRRFKSFTTPEATLIVESFDIYKTDDP